MSINRNNTSETPKKAALYVRVSTNYQIDRDSLPMQRQELITYAQLMFGINDYVVFEDAGYSGKNTDRPEFQNMMRRIRAGEFIFSAGRLTVSPGIFWTLHLCTRN